jgi:3-methyladenine DNA glycosylase AlkC
MGLHLPGGWSFSLKVGTLVDGTWSPKAGEWLLGTEIRRVIAIPWNKQLEAVAYTFVPGDIIVLDMSNGDKQDYKVQSVTKVPVSDANLLYDTHPSLALILIDPASSDRLVIIALP